MKKFLNVVLILFLVMSILPFSTKSKPKYKLKSVQVSLKENKNIRKEKNVWYLVKGTKTKINIKPTVSKKNIKVSVSKKFKSSNKKIVQVNKSGVLVAKKNGKVNIKITVKGKKKVKGTKKNTIKIIVLAKNVFDKKFNQSKKKQEQPIIISKPTINNPDNTENKDDTVVSEDKTKESETENYTKEENKSGFEGNNNTDNASDEKNQESSTDNHTEENKKDLDETSGKVDETSDEVKETSDKADETSGKVEETTSEVKDTTDKVEETKITRYEYKVKFFNPPYSKTDTPIFIETDNPESLNYIICFLNADGSKASYSKCGGIDYQDIPGYDYIPEDYIVNGGKISTFTFDTSGEIIVAVKEYPKGKAYYNKSSYVTKPIGKIVINDYKKLENEWMTNIINQTTNSSMTKAEKMRAIEEYLTIHTKYRKNYIYKDKGMVYLNLVTDTGIPSIITGEFDSYTSPSLLVAFGEKIGYPLRSMYYDYSYGSAEWQEYHAKAQSIEDGSLYDCCNLSITNRYPYQSEDDVPKVDCLTYDKYVECY